MLELPNPPRQAEPNPNAADPEPGPGEQPAATLAFLYAATCPALRTWSEEVGFQVAHIGIAADPLTRVAGLKETGYAALSYFLRPYEEDLSFGDWHLVPLEMPAGARVPDGCDGWGGALRVPLPAGAAPYDLAQRLAMMLRPLEAHLCAQLPEAVERRAEQRKFLPVLPRYSVGGPRTTLVQDLYRLSEAEDLAFVADALAAALATLGEGRAAFDRVVEVLAGAPSARQGGYAGDLAGTERAGGR